MDTYLSSIPFEYYDIALKIGFGAMFIASLLLIVNAVLSAKQMGGTLGVGLKKIAAGSIADTILILTYVLLLKGNRGMLTDQQITAFFLVIGIIGSSLLISGYIQIYRISKKLKLFTI